MEQTEPRNHGILWILDFGIWNLKRSLVMGSESWNPSGMELRRQPFIVRERFAGGLGVETLV